MCHLPDNKENEIDEKVYATEERYAEQSKRIKAEKSKILSNWEREEIFFVRWLTFIMATLIIVIINWIFFNFDGHTGLVIVIINIFIPPFFFFRKAIKTLLKEKISYWWSMLNGRIP